MKITNENFFILHVKFKIEHDIQKTLIRDKFNSICDKTFCFSNYNYFNLTYGSIFGFDNEKDFNNSELLEIDILESLNLLEFAPMIKKPSLGLMPENIFLENRIKNLLEAINQNICDDLTDHKKINLIQKWTNELNSHLTRLYDINKKVK